MTTKQKTLTTFILSAIFLTSVGVYQQALADIPHSTPPLVATFGPGEDHPYTDVSESKEDTVTYGPPASIAGGWIDAVEATYMGGGPEPIPDFSETYFILGFPLPVPVNFVKGYEEAEFTFTGLEAMNQYKVTVTIDNLGDFTTASDIPEIPGGLWKDAASSIPILETIFVTGNGVELGSVTAVFGETGSGPAFNPADQTITKTLELVAISNGAGELTVGFNDYFQWDPTDTFNTSPGVCTPTKIAATSCIGSQSALRVAEISLTHQPDYLIADKAEIETKTDKNEVKLKFHALDTIPTAGAFGYGILTSTDSLLIATTHGGVLDSQDQVNKDDAVWHTHYVDLTDDEILCDGSAVIPSRLTFTSPGEVKLKDNKLEIKKAPLTDYRDVNFFGGTLEHYDLGALGDGTAVSFTLEAIGVIDGIPSAVCVNDIQVFDAKLKEKP